MTLEIASSSTAADALPVEISVVVPLYCEESNIDYLFKRLGGAGWSKHVL